MASSFGGTVKLSGESEYVKALRNINSNLKAVSSELKLASTEFNNNGQKIGDLRTQNDALNKKLKEEQSVVKTCAEAIKNFTEQQSKNKTEIDKLKTSLDSEKQTLEKMKNSTTATSSEISKQEKVVAELEKELSKAESSYDSNNKKINDYKVKMNTAKSECSDLSKKISDNNSILSKTKNNFEDNAKSIKDFAKEEENAGQKTLTLGDLIKGNLISEGIIAGIKGLASAMKTVGSALLDVGKSAIQSYADYEQLVGGVESMFGGLEKGSEQINKVMGLSKNAWKDLTMSQNDYITAFNSTYPLMKNDIADQNEAIEKTNRIMTLNSDLANTFGYSMDTASNAVNWALKGTFSYLDNLNIGIKGTKQGFLEAAQSVGYTVKSVDELSSSDILDILEKCADKYGVLGKTADEAKTTIQGSTKMMKSAWSNLLTGITDDSADFTSLVNDFVDSVVNAGEQLLPRVEATLSGIGQLIVSLADTLLPKVIDMGVKLIGNLVQGISQNLPSIMASINQVINTIISGLVQMLPQILEMGIQLIVSLAQGLAQSLPTLVPQIVNAVVLMVTTLLDNIDLIIDAGIQLIMGLAEGLINALPDLIDKIPEIIDKLIMAITDNLPKIIEAGIILTVKLAEGLIKAIPQLVSKIPQIISSLVKGIANYFGKMLSVGKELLGKVKDGIVSGISGMANVGKDLVKGLWNGIKNAKDWVMDKIKGFGSSIVKGIKGIFGIHSPSTVFRDEIGSNLAKGIGVGFTSEMKDVNSMIQNSLPTDFDLDTKVNLNSIGTNGLSLGASSNNNPVGNVENNTFNIYSPKDSPSEYARRIRQELQYQKMVG